MAQLQVVERETESRIWSAGHCGKAISERLVRRRSTIGRELNCDGKVDGSHSAITLKGERAFAAASGHSFASCSVLN